MTSEQIITLDIGTRKIAGLILNKAEDQYVIQHGVIKEQLPDAMRDGQIHDITKVAHTINQVIQELGPPETAVSQVAVAAAGRSLITHRGQSNLRLMKYRTITSEQVKTLELTAVQQALKGLTQNAETSGDSYLCVGYSVVRYSLDEQPINSLIGHQGITARVEIIATFLPRIVIDSLAYALQLAQLDMASLTLEPIAAMHTIVPQSMRMLNLALVDVGAGTSDIAICSQGTITGYGMVPIAGDEITHVIAENYLLDFLVAEQAKRQLISNQTVEFMDVLGNSHALATQEISAVIEPAVEKLAQSIGDEILRLNETAPKGVMLVGGGSLTPGLTNKLADYLGMPLHLVRMRDRESLTHITGAPSLTGPQIITPIGIGFAHLNDLCMELQKVTINDRTIQFLKLPNATVGDALLHAGYTVRDLMGTPGQAISISINGQRVTVPGGLGTSADITVNGNIGSLDTPLGDDDIITVLAPKNGDQAFVTLRDIVEASPLNIKINGSPYCLTPKIQVNSKTQPYTYQIQENDSITIEEVSTVAQALKFAGILRRKEIRVFINGEERCLACTEQLSINGSPGGMDSFIANNMSIDYQWQSITLKEALQIEEIPEVIVTVNGEPITLMSQSKMARVNGEARPLDYMLHHSDRVECSPMKSGDFILSDIFRAYKFEPGSSHKHVQIMLNQRTAGYTDPIKSGDIITITAK